LARLDGGRAKHRGAAALDERIGRGERVRAGDGEIERRLRAWPQHRAGQFEPRRGTVSRHLRTILIDERRIARAAFFGSWARQIGREIGLVRYANLAASEISEMRLQMERLPRLRNPYRDRQDDRAAIADGLESLYREALGRRPGDGRIGEIGRALPIELGR